MNPVVFGCCVCGGLQHGSKQRGGFIPSNVEHRWGEEAVCSSVEQMVHWMTLVIFDQHAGQHSPVGPVEC